MYILYNCQLCMYVSVHWRYKHLIKEKGIFVETHLLRICGTTGKRLLLSDWMQQTTGPLALGVSVEEGLCGRSIQSKLISCVLRLIVQWKPTYERGIVIRDLVRLHVCTYANYVVPW